MNSTTQARRLPLLDRRRGGGSGEPAPHPVPPAFDRIEAPGGPGGRSAALLITVEEAARRLSIGRSHVYRYIDDGRLRSVRLGRSRRIAPADLAEFVDRVREAGMA